MPNLNFISVASFALKNHCSFIGGRPCLNVLTGIQGEIIFLFKSNFAAGIRPFGRNLFIQWIRWNFDSVNYQEQQLNYKSVQYVAVFLKVPHKINRKFLLTFKSFSQQAPHLLGYFLN